MPSEPTRANASQALAERFRKATSKILQRWEDRVRAALPVARAQDDLALRDTLPALLDELVAILEDVDPLRVLKQGENEIAAEHGRQRALMAEYPLDDVIAEYRILRSVILDELEGEGPLGAEQRDVVLDLVDSAVQYAAREFMRVRSTEREHSVSELARANRELDETVRERTAELTRSEQLFSLLVDGVRDYAIFTIDPHGVITTWNKGAERMKGYHSEEIIGVHYSILYPAEGQRRDEPMSHLRSALEEGRFRGEGMRIRKNRELFLADVLITPMFEHDELVGYSKVVEDLTERNLLMQERDLSRSESDSVRREQEQRERFIATLTHDIRSPLSTAMMTLDQIARHPGDPEWVKTQLERVRRSIGHLDVMARDLLDKSRVQTQQHLDQGLAPCDLAHVVRESCGDLASQHGDRFIVHVEGDCVGQWSCQALRRVVDNLLQNAVKYGSQTEPVTTTVRRVEDRVLLSVHNQGSLIPADEQVRLFSPFHRTEEASRSPMGGWGLGLTLVRDVAEAHGGMVKVESYPIRGTTFTVDLPVDAQPHQDPPQARAPR